MNVRRLIIFTICPLFLLCLTGGLFFQIDANCAPLYYGGKGISVLDTSTDYEVLGYFTWGLPADDYNNGVEIDSAGNVYLVGYNSVYVLLKCAINGTLNVIWERHPNCGPYMELDSAGSFYLCGGSDKVEVDKWNSSGDNVWHNTWDKYGDDKGKGIVINNSTGDIYACGTTIDGNSRFDMVLVKFAPNGTFFWYHQWGYTLFSFYGNDKANDIAIDSSGAIYMCGATDSFSWDNFDIVLVKYSSDGKKLWNTSYGGSMYAGANGVAVDSLGNVYVCGEFTSEATGSDLILIKYSSDGHRIWSRTWGGRYQDGGYELALDTRGNIYVCGYTYTGETANEDFVLVAFDPSGSMLWSRTWGGPLSDLAYDVEVDAVGNIYVSGRTKSFGVGGWDFALVKFGIPESTNMDQIPGFSLAYLLIGTAIPILLFYSFCRSRRLERARQEKTLTLSPQEISDEKIVRIQLALAVINYSVVFGSDENALSTFFTIIGRNYREIYIRLNEFVTRFRQRLVGREDYEELMEIINNLSN